MTPSGTVQEGTGPQQPAPRPPILCGTPAARTTPSGTVLDHSSLHHTLCTGQRRSRSFSVNSSLVSCGQMHGVVNNSLAIKFWRVSKTETNAFWIPRIESGFHEAAVNISVRGEVLFESGQGVHMVIGSSRFPCPVSPRAAGPACVLWL